MIILNPDIIIIDEGERNDDMDALKTILVFIKAIMSVLIPVMFVITAVATAYGCLVKLIIRRRGGE